MEQISKVIKKMRRMFCFGEYADIVKQSADIILFEEEDGTFAVDCIKFDYYDEIVFYPKSGIYFNPEHGRSRLLLACSSIEDFLNI